MARLTPVLAATTLAAGIVAGVFWQQLQAERASSADLQQRIARLEQQLQMPAAPPVAPATTAPEPAPPAPSAIPAAAPPPPPPPQPVMTLTDLRNNPELCTAQKAQMRASLPQTYPDAARALGLSAAESTALFDLVARQQDAQIDAAICGKGPQIPTPARDQAEIRALLGPAKYQEWQEYLPTREGRVRVNQLRTALAMSDTPLTETQTDPLLASVLAEGKRRREENAARVAPTDPRARLDFEEETIRLLEESQARLVASAQQYLSPQQVAVMRNSMINQVSMQKAMLQARRRQMENAGTRDGAAAVPGEGMQVIAVTPP